MRVRELLSRDHAAFRALLDALERDPREPEERARAEAARTLRALLASLDRHEELEDAVFDAPSPAGGGALETVRAQHREMESLREEILYALELADRCPIRRVRALSGFLVQSLRAHLQTEELQLWPGCADLLDRPADPDLADPLHRREVLRERRQRRGLASIAASFH